MRYNGSYKFIKKKILFKKNYFLKRFFLGILKKN